MEIVERSKPYARQFIIFGLGTILVLALAFFVPQLATLRIAASFAVLPAMLYLIVLGVRLYRSSDKPLPLGLFGGGVFFTVGGIVFDIAATLSQTPSLELEYNPVVRAFFEYGYTPEFVLIYGGITQGILIVVTAVLWGGLLRHLSTIIDTAYEKAPDTLLNFLKAASGGAHLTWRQYFLPLRRSELPDAYYFLWLIVVIWVGSLLGRWYLGLQWFSSGPRLSVLIVALAGMLIAIVLYYTWLGLAYSN